MGIPSLLEHIYSEINEANLVKVYVVQYKVIYGNLIWIGTYYVFSDMYLSLQKKYIDKFWQIGIWSKSQTKEHKKPYLSPSISPEEHRTNFLGIRETACVLTDVSCFWYLIRLRVLWPREDTLIQNFFVSKLFLKLRVAS